MRLGRVRSLGTPSTSTASQRGERLLAILTLCALSHATPVPARPAGSGRSHTRRGRTATAGSPSASAGSPSSFSTPVCRQLGSTPAEASAGPTPLPRRHADAWIYPSVYPLAKPQWFWLNATLASINRTATPWLLAVGHRASELVA